jgi:hypothetical protein
MKNFEVIRKTLKSNDKRMITPFNLFYSFKAILGNPVFRLPKQDSENIFTHILSEEREIV